MSLAMAPSPTSDRTAPAAHELHAAHLLGQVFTQQGTPEHSVTPSYNSLRTGGLYNDESLQRARHLLEDLGLLVCADGLVMATAELVALHKLPETVFVEALLQRWLVARAGLWLYAFAREPEPQWGEVVPEGANKLLAAVYERPGQRRAIVRMLAHKVDFEANAAAGLAGELAVVAACQEHLNQAGRPDLAAEVTRVSEFNDTLGFDVTSPDRSGIRHNLEVKTTRSPHGPVEFFLSRNEVLVGSTDPGWSIVVARQGIDEQCHIVGWTPYATIADLLPSDAEPDAGRRGRWASVRITLDESLLTSGLPLDKRTPAGT